MFIIRNRKIFFILSGILFGASLLAMLFYGLHLGIDFTGGSLLEVAYDEEKPSTSEVSERLNTLSFLGSFSLREAGEEGFILRTKDLTVEQKEEVLGALSFEDKRGVEERRFNSIGPLLGQELLRKALIALLLAAVGLILFIAFVFRKVSEPVSSWIYGLIAIAALVFDILLPAGLFAFLGEFGGVEIDSLFITALLVILGYAINDTIVVFDRVRENLRLDREYRQHEPFEAIVGKSLEQTFVRSINTSFTVVLVLLALFFVGSESTKMFSLALLVGIVVGAYASLFLATPLLVSFEKWRTKRASR